jgi:hypothetical protein
MGKKNDAIKKAHRRSVMGNKGKRRKEGALLGYMRMAKKGKRSTALLPLDGCIIIRALRRRYRLLPRGHKLQCVYSLLR